MSKLRADFSRGSGRSQSNRIQQIYEDARMPLLQRASFSLKRPKRRSSVDLEAGNGKYIGAKARIMERILSHQMKYETWCSAEKRKEMVESTQKHLLESTKQSIFYPIEQRDRTEYPKKYVLNVAALQAYAIRTCQSRIVESARDLLQEKEDGNLLECVHQYCEALRDMEYMQDKAKLGYDKDPFLLTTSKQDERAMMYSLGLIPRWLQDHVPDANDKDDPVLPGLGRTARNHEAERRARIYNVLSALFGGLSLIAPMVIMKLIPTRTCVLVTTCSFVLTFALTIAFWSGLRHNEILAVTAAYAAVLVVFVGTTTH